MLPRGSVTWTARQRLVWGAWLALLVSLPVTSQPHLAAYVGGGPVSPLSLIPLALILAVGIAPQLRFGLQLPRPSTPLLLFAAAAVLSTVLAPWLGLAPFKGVDVVQRGLRGMMTLGIGVGFYLASAVIADTPARIRASLIAIAVGAAVMLAWSGLQLAHFPNRNDPYPVWMTQVHEWISLRELLRGRVSGMAYEPSWLADQLVVFYLPLWTASVLRRETAFGIRRGAVTGELMLLGWGTVILLGTFSRIGVAAWLLVIGVLALAGGRALGQRLGFRGGRRWLGRVGPALGSLGVIVVGLILLLAAAQVDRRVAQVFQIDVQAILESQHPVWYNLANRLRYAERVMYWTTAARAFALYPVLGVGLGNTGFLIREVMPAFGYVLPEMLVAVDPGSPVFPNPKSLWFRLFSETGAVGFVLFAVFLVVAAAAGWLLHRRGQGVLGVIGVASLLSLLALLVEGFSLDTFALPHPWILLGMTGGLWSRLALRDEAS